MLQHAVLCYACRFLYRHGAIAGDTQGGSPLGPRLRHCLTQQQQIQRCGGHVRGRMQPPAAAVVVGIPYAET